MFSGALSALITPFRDGEVDERALRELIEWQIQNKIDGVKESSESLDQVSDIRRLCGERLTILSGDDSLTLPIMAVGGKGVLSVISNMMPREMHEMAAAALADDYARARDVHFKLLPL